MTIKLVLLSTFVLGLSALSVSQEAHANKEAKNGQRAADTAFKEGVALANKGKLVEALEKFEIAYAKKPHPIVLFNIAGTQRLLGRYREAHDSYSRFLLEGEGVVKSTLLRRARSDRKDLLELVARVKIDCGGIDGSIRIDSKAIGTCPDLSEQFLSPGQRVLSWEIGGQEESQLLDLSAGERKEVALGGSLPTKPVNEGSASAEVVPPQEDRENVSERNTQKLVSAPPHVSPAREAGLVLSAGFGTNLKALSDTGAPTMSVFYRSAKRWSVGLHGVALAYSLVPELRYRVFGRETRVELVLAAPVSVDSDSELFIAGAGGLRVEQSLGSALNVSIEILASYAGARRGLTVPAILSLGWLL